MGLSWGGGSGCERGWSGAPALLLLRVVPFPHHANTNTNVDTPALTHSQFGISALRSIFAGKTADTYEGWSVGGRGGD